MILAQRAAFFTWNVPSVWRDRISASPILPGQRHSSYAEDQGWQINAESARLGSRGRLASCTGRSALPPGLEVLQL